MTKPVRIKPIQFGLLKPWECSRPVSPGGEGVQVQQAFLRMRCWDGSEQPWKDSVFCWLYPGPLRIAEGAPGYPLAPTLRRAPAQPQREGLLDFETPWGQTRGCSGGGGGGCPPTTATTMAGHLLVLRNQSLALQRSRVPLRARAHPFCFVQTQRAPKAIWGGKNPQGRPWHLPSWG